MALVTNKKALFDFEVLERFSAGIELLGAEVKSLKQGHARLDGAYASFKRGELYLRGLSISPYQANNPSASFDNDRVRKLLLSKKELLEIEGKLSTQGLTLVPISLYNNGRFIKVELALARGKKKYDRRETIKKRDTDRDLKRSLKI